jgi:hypothetical protein
LTSKAGAFLSSQGVAVSLVNHRLRLAASPPPPIHLDQAQAVHSFLIQQQALRRINNAAALLEYTPEALCLDVGSQLRPLLACLQELGLSQASCYCCTCGRCYECIRRRCSPCGFFMPFASQSWLSRMQPLGGMS